MIAELAKKLYASEVAKMCGGQLHGRDTVIDHISTDSRELTPGTMFIALKGERFDGNDFVSAVLEGEGVSAMAERLPGNIEEGSAVIIVDDCVKALGRLASAYRSLFKVTVVAVTGSVGKTTTKEFVYSVLSCKYNVIKTEGNHNNHIGLPMTIFSLKEDTQAAVIEMGMSGYGEIAYLSGIAKPDVGLITNIGTSHIEKLGSREGIAKAKLEITEGMPESGILMLQGDEELLKGHKALYIGKSADCDYRISGIIEGANGTAFDLEVDGSVIESITVPTFGEHNVMNAAFAYAVGASLGMGEFEIRRGLMSYRTTGMRQSIGEFRGGTIIEDCYNASPESMIASLKVLANLSSRDKKRSVAVLGDMLELGFYSDEGHRRVGAAAAYERIDSLITFGPEACKIAKAAVDFGMDREKVFVFPDKNDVEKIGNFILKYTGKCDIILFKASRGIRLERVIEYVRNN